MKNLIKFVTVLIIVCFINLQSVQAYNYNWKIYNIKVSEKIEYYEYCYNSRRCEVPNKYKKLIYLNILLIKKWYDPIY
jgi:hypothetical protein